MVGTGCGDVCRVSDVSAATRDAKLYGMTRALVAWRALSALTRPRADRGTRCFLGGSDSPPSCPPVRPAVKITYLLTRQSLKIHKRNKQGRSPLEQL